MTNNDNPAQSTTQPPVNSGASTGTAQQVFDTRYIAYVFNQRGYRVNEFAGRLDLSNNVVEAFLRDTVEPGDLRLATLTNMANLLGIPLASMFLPPPAAPDPSDIKDEPDTNAPDDAAADAAADAEQLIACVYDTGRATAVLVGDIAAAFGWTIDRVYSAAVEATRRLAPAGLQVNTSHGELFITPVRDHREAHRVLTARKVYERGLASIHYKAVHQLLNGKDVTVSNSARQRLRFLGGLANLGIIDNPLKPSITEQAREAFL